MKNKYTVCELCVYIVYTVKYAYIIYKYIKYLHHQLCYTLLFIYVFNIFIDI